MTTFLYIHEAIRRDAQRLAAACAAARGDGELRALERWYARFQLQLDEHHRAEENLFFPTLRTRDATLAVHLEGLEEDHRELVTRLGAITTAFAGLDRAALVEQTRRLATLLDEHLAAEEAVVVPATISRLTVDEQRALEDGLRRRAPLAQLAFALPWVITAVPDEQRAAVLQQLPLPLRVLHSAFWRRSYERLAAPLALGDRRAA